MFFFYFYMLKGLSQTGPPLLGWRASRNVRTAVFARTCHCTAICNNGPYCDIVVLLYSSVRRCTSPQCCHGWM